ncbi:hypothetical protein ACWD6N_37030 [Micromonospora sp. NPDC005163]
MAALVAAAATLVTPASVSLPAGGKAGWNDVKNAWDLMVAAEGRELLSTYPVPLGVAIVALAIALWDPRGGRHEIRNAREGKMGDAVVTHSFRIVITGIAVAALCAVAAIFGTELFSLPQNAKQFTFGAAYRLWLPSEEIVLNDGKRFVGYTLTTKDNWHIMLREDTRTIEYAPVLRVTERRACVIDARSVDRRPPLLPIAPAAKPAPACPILAHTR